MSMSQMDADIKANWSQQTKAHPKFEFAVITFWYNQLLFLFLCHVWSCVGSHYFTEITLIREIIFW